MPRFAATHCGETQQLGARRRDPGEPQQRTAFFSFTPQPAAARRRAGSNPVSFFFSLPRNNLRRLNGRGARPLARPVP
jgi:hypothetical protein